MEKAEYQGDLLGEVAKRDGVTILLFSRNFKGFSYFEIREWISNGTYEGPGRQGVTFPPRVLPDVARLLDSVVAESGDEE
jgi:hypothetical protein